MSAGAGGVSSSCSRPIHPHHPDILAFLEWGLRLRRKLQSRGADSWWRWLLLWTCGEGSVRWSGFESTFGFVESFGFSLFESLSSPSSWSGAKGLVTAALGGGSMLQFCSCLFGLVVVVV
ncbi:hypothetical protein N665_1503s0006 [Sinapis alba]|nr:hypothetical protein N665_1503s0006 [Sinapis alba]